MRRAGAVAAAALGARQAVEQLSPGELLALARALAGRRHAPAPERAENTLNGEASKCRCLE